MNEDFHKLALSLQDGHYSDNEAYFSEVLKTTYDLLLEGKFAMLIENQTLPGGYKSGYSRGGVRFNPSEVSIEDYKKAVISFENQLKAKKYLYVIIDHLKPISEYTEILGDKITNSPKKGTAIIYPIQDWVSKFKSKDRYNLTYAGKKGIEIEIYTSESFYNINIEAFQDLLNKCKVKAAGLYYLPDFNRIESLIKTLPSYLVLAKLNDKYIAFNISVYNPSKSRLERVFAGSDSRNYGSFRAPEYLEIKFIEFLAKIGVKYYDLWMLNEGDGFTAFKSKLADKIIDFAPRSVWYMNPIIGKPYYWLSILKNKILS